MNSNNRRELEENSPITVIGQGDMEWSKARNVSYMFILLGMLFTSSWISIAYTDPLTFDNRLIYFSPPYVESNLEFTKASKYLLQRLPFEDRPYSNSEARKNFGFGIVVGIAKELAYAIRPQNHPKRYQALQILSDYIPQACNDYNYIVNETKSLLTEADMKIEPIVNIIDAVCIGLEDRTCNRKIQQLLKIAKFLRPHADLLLQLGTVSKKVNGFSNTFDSISEEGQEIQFLRHHADDPYVRRLMKELYVTYSLINKIK